LFTYGSCCKVAEITQILGHFFYGTWHV
jgi:hypothetical protein